MLLLSNCNEIFRTVNLKTDNYDILHNPKVQNKYPNLYEVVYEYINNKHSCNVDLTFEQFKEWEAYKFDLSIGYTGGIRI